MQPGFILLSLDEMDVEVDLKLNDRVTSITCVDEAGWESDSLTFTLDDRDKQDLPVKIGDRLKLYMGYNETWYMFMGIYTINDYEFTGPPLSVKVNAKACDMSGALKSKKTRSWTSKTIGQIVSEIASKHKLKPNVDPDLANITIRHIEQTCESDLNFLARLAMQRDAIVKPADGKLHFTKYGKSKMHSDEKKHRINLSAKDITSFTMVYNSRAKYASSVAYYYDTSKAKKIKVTAGSGEPVYVDRHSYNGEEEAKAGAEANLKKAARDVFSLDLNLPGNPDIAADSIIVLSGVRQGVDGEWVVKTAEHTISGEGYKTRVKGEKLI